METEKTRVIIAGSRTFRDYVYLKKICDFVIDGAEVEIVSGTAQGADKLGEKYALEKSFRVKRFPAKWHEYGKRAGFFRNIEMAKYADVLIAFWDGESRGTKHMIENAKKEGLRTIVVTSWKTENESNPHSK